MALLGAQLVITLIMISVIQKVGPHFSFAKWLLCSTGLVRYLYPTDVELKQVANIAIKQKPKRNKMGLLNGKAEIFHVPRNIDIELSTAKVIPLDVVHLRFYAEYQWLVDFSMYACAVYILTEIYQNYFPFKEEMNLSMMWNSLVLIFAVKLLFSLTIQYFKTEESVGERSTCLVMGFVYLLIAMMILIIDESTLELGLETAYESFNASASIFLNNQGLSSTGPASKLILKCCLALCSSILGALFTFPGLRIARMHWDILKYYRNNKLKQFLLNFAFALPFFLVIAWIKPIARNYLTVRVFSGMSTPLISEEAFESFRLIMIVCVICIKLSLMPFYLQAYLNMAYHRIEELKKEAGRITNVDLQKKVAAVFYYLCVVTLQYIAPIIIMLYLTLMYKTLGDFSWTGFFTNTGVKKCPISQPIDILRSNSDEQSIKESAQQFHLALENLKSIFTTEVFRGLFGFGIWWCCFSYFATTSIGMVYQSYFSQ